MDRNATYLSILGIWGNGTDIYTGFGVDYNVINSVLTCYLEGGSGTPICVYHTQLS